jgi:porphobilinogen synthase
MTTIHDRPDTFTVDPTHRLRRTRRTEALRSFVRETRIHPRNLVAPIFVQPGHESRQPVGSMPGVERVSPDEAVVDARKLAQLGVGGVILFGLPSSKDALGTGAWIQDGIVQETLRRLRDADLDIVPSPTRACANTPITGTADHCCRTDRSITTRPWSASPRPRRRRQ